MRDKQSELDGLLEKFEIYLRRTAAAGSHIADLLEKDKELKLCPSFLLALRDLNKLLEKLEPLDAIGRLLK